MNPGITEEVGKQVGGFMDVMRTQPLSLALVVMNFVLLGYLFYSGSSTSTQRRETVGLIVKWQQDTDKIMASCVSKEVMEMVLKSLERDRELYRALLPSHKNPETPAPTPQSFKPKPVNPVLPLPIIERIQYGGR